MIESIFIILQFSTINLSSRLYSIINVSISILLIYPYHSLNPYFFHLIFISTRFLSSNHSIISIHKVLIAYLNYIMILALSSNPIHLSLILSSNILSILSVISSVVNFISLLYIYTLIIYVPTFITIALFCIDVIIFSTLISLITL